MYVCETGNIQHLNISVKLEVDVDDVRREKYFTLASLLPTRWRNMAWNGPGNIPGVN